MKKLPNQDIIDAIEIEEKMMLCYYMGKDLKDEADVRKQAREWIYKKYGVKILT